MITESLIRQLKQVNVSKDAEKTQPRTSEAWKTASKDEQNTILELTGLKRSSVQRAYKTGNISAKIVVAMAQTLNLDPMYLTGETDERDICSDDSLRVFLTNHGYQELLPNHPPKKRKRRARASQEAAEPALPVPEPVAAPAAEVSADRPESEQLQESAPFSEEAKAFLDSVTEDEIMLLVKTMLLRAKAGGKHAEKAQQLKLFLLD